MGFCFAVTNHLIYYFLMNQNTRTTPLVFNADIVRPRRRLLAFLGDIILFYIVAATIYMLGIYPLVTHLPSFKAPYESQTIKLEECRQMYKDASLVYLDDNGGVVSRTLTPQRYIQDKISMEDYREDNKYLDPLYYFYLNYANENITKDNVSYHFDENYVRSEIFRIDQQEEPILWDKTYDGPIRLTEEAKNYLSAYLANDITAVNSAYYNKIANFIENSLLDAEKILLESDQYQTAYKSIMRDNITIYYHLSISSIISYTVFFFLYYLLIPYLLKHGQTPVMRILRLSMVKEDNQGVDFKILLLRSLMQFIAYSFIVLLLPYFVIGSAIFSLPLISVLGGTINLFVLAIFSILLLIASGITCLVTEYKQNIYDRITRVYHLDLRTERPLDLIKENQNGGSEI